MDNTPPHEKSLPAKRKSLFLAPSPRVTAALAAAMLAVGVAVGAAIGPAPSPSFAGASGLPLPLLLRTLGVGETTHPSLTASSANVQPPRVTETPAPSPAGSGVHQGTATASPPPPASTPSSGQAPEQTGSPSPSSPTKAPASTPASRLAPVSKVWLIELSGTGFAEATAQSAAAAFIDTQAIGQGTLLSGWSALDASSFANSAAAISSSPPQLLDTIVQPPCPASSPEGEGAPGAQCAPDTPGGLKAADEFLAQTLPAITSTAPYRENGLVVITFATVAPGSATGLPSGATSATLTSQPPAGALLISPFAGAGAHSSVPFTPTSPVHSLEKLLHK